MICGTIYLVGWAVTTVILVVTFDFKIADTILPKWVAWSVAILSGLAYGAIWPILVVRRAVVAEKP